MGKTAVVDTPLFINRFGWIALGTHIRTCREARGWNLEDVIERIEAMYRDRGIEPPISKATLSNIERGCVKPTIEKLLPLIALGYITDTNGQPMDFDDLLSFAGKHSARAVEFSDGALVPS
jgi:transcriptional regulator with XRE-family HTH domain